MSSRFPDTFAHYDRALLLKAYENGPLRLRTAVASLPYDALAAHPIHGKWSIAQITLHLADAELMGATRIRLVLADDRPELTGYNQDAWATALHYAPHAPQHLQHTLQLFSALRATTLFLLEQASEDDWERIGVHPEHGAVTLRNLLELYADHSERHVRQIVERRRLLGFPIHLKPMLPDLLY